MKKYNFLNINPSNMIVLKFHILLLYIYHQTVLKQCFFQSYVYFQVRKRRFLAKTMFFTKIL